MNRKTTIILLLLFAVTSAFSATRTWKAGTIGDWHTAGNWVENIVPAAGDDVFITTAGVTSTLAASSAALNSLTLAGTLVFTNWNTTLSATDVTIQSGGVMTCSVPFTDVQMSNNVYVVCTDMTIDADGKIDVNGKGYSGGITNANGFGTGHGTGASSWANGAGHGGWSSKRGTAITGRSYGDSATPLMPGSGGGAGGSVSGGHGGGAVRIVSDGAITVNGTITANGLNGGSAHAGAGSGGSIYIQCRTITGINGSVRADGGKGGGGFYTSYAGSGGGGRIAVVYNQAAQGVLPVPDVFFSVLPGASGIFAEKGALAADLGTLHFPDSYLLRENIASNSLAGSIVGLTEWNTPELVISNTWIRFPENGFSLTVENDITVSGVRSRLDLGGGGIVDVYREYFYDGAAIGPSLDVGGNMTVTNGGWVYIYAGETDSFDGYGALVDVGQKLFVGTNSSIMPFSNSKSGMSVFFQTYDLTLAQGGAFNADSAGYNSGHTVYAGTQDGFGQGGGEGGRAAGGGGYGGAGATVTYAGGSAYGEADAPVFPGSGGGSAYDWSSVGRGGGLIRIEVLRRCEIAGLITALGRAGWYWDGAGSGGGIYLRCKYFFGSATGLLQADGGATGGSGGGAGGGGRIAVWRMYDKSSETVPASAARGSDAAEDGTIVWGWIPPEGIVIQFW